MEIICSIVVINNINKVLPGTGFDQLNLSINSLNHFCDTILSMYLA